MSWLRSLARAHTEQAMRTIAGHLNSENPMVALKASEILLDRGWGKAVQPIAGDDQTPLIVEIIQRVREPKA